MCTAFFEKPRAEPSAVHTMHREGRREACGLTCPFCRRIARFRIPCPARISTSFSAEGSVLLHPGDPGFFDCNGRARWQLSGDCGYRASCATNSCQDTSRRELAYYGPQSALCAVQECPYGQILKADDLPQHCLGTFCIISGCCQAAPVCPIVTCPTARLSGFHGDGVSQPR